jgi:hypothetical protein
MAGIRSSLVVSLLHLLAASTRKHNPGHYLRLFDVPELCPHLSFVIPWQVGRAETEEGVVLLRQGPLVLRQVYHGIGQIQCNRSNQRFQKFVKYDISFEAHDNIAVI